MFYPQRRETNQSDMADCVVTFLLQNLTQLLSQESQLLGGVGDQVRLLQNELSLINVFLQNTEGKRHDNELVKQLVPLHPFIIGPT